jgi:hypothetical protein
MMAMPESSKEWSTNKIYYGYKSSMHLTKGVELVAFGGELYIFSLFLLLLRLIKKSLFNL